MVGDGMGAHAVYTVCMRTTLPTFQKETAVVTRRFSDFTWLRTRLQASFPGRAWHGIPFTPELNPPLHRSSYAHLILWRCSS